MTGVSLPSPRAAMTRSARVAPFALAVALLPLSAAAGGFTDAGQDLGTHGDPVRVAVDLRLRGALLYNFDLDRGLTPSGKALYAVPSRDPEGQALSAADARLRVDAAAFAPSGTLALKVRTDMVDASFVTAPGGIDGMPGHRPEESRGALRVRRAYAEWLTPVGVITAGRMGSGWGMGLLANGGDAPDAGRGDSADRVAFITPLAGHLFAAAYDFEAVGPEARASDSPGLDAAEPVHAVTVAVLRWRDGLSRDRRRGAGKTTFDYGAFASHGRASLGGTPLRVLAVDAWARLDGPGFRVEAEAAVLDALATRVAATPGVTLRGEVRSRQVGAAVESEWAGARARAGIDFGFAGGDPAPGFGVSTEGGAHVAGDLDGPQAFPPYDRRVDNFRFHPDYRIDRILFHEIVGTVTDAIYVRPHVRWRLGGALSASVAAIGSRAVYASSTPGGKAPLGIEIDPTLLYRTRDGMGAALEYAVLFPLAGLDNPDEGLSALPAQLVRLRLEYSF